MILDTPQYMALDWLRCANCLEEGGMIAGHRQIEFLCFAFDGKLKPDVVRGKSHDLGTTALPT